MLRECIDLVHDVEVSHENVINHIPITFMNEQLCMKCFSFHPLIILENIINLVNVDPIIMKLFFY